MNKVAKVFGGGSAKKSTPQVELPTLEQPAEIPDADVTKLNAAAAQAKRKKSGRAGTIVSDEDYLG